MGVVPQFKVVFSVKCELWAYRGERNVLKMCILISMYFLDKVCILIFMYFFDKSFISNFRRKTDGAYIS